MALACLRDRSKDVRQERGLVATAGWARRYLSRQEKRRIGLDEESIARDLAHQLEQVRASSRIADPPVIPM